MLVLPQAVLESGKIVQIGSQRRSAPNYHAANDFIRSGKFGKITMVEMCWNVNQPGRWRRPALVAQCFERDTDWKRFLLNRPYEEWTRVSIWNIACSGVFFRHSRPVDVTSDRYGTLVYWLHTRIVSQQWWNLSME